MSDNRSSNLRTEFISGEADQQRIWVGLQNLDGRLSELRTILEAVGSLSKPLTSPTECWQARDGEHLLERVKAFVDSWRIQLENGRPISIEELVRDLSRYNGNLSTVMSSLRVCS